MKVSSLPSAVAGLAILVHAQPILEEILLAILSGSTQKWFDSLAAYRVSQPNQMASGKHQT